MNHSGGNTISVLLTGTSYPRNDQDWRGRFISDMVDALSCRRAVSLRTWLPPGNICSNVADAALPEESRFLEKLAEAGGIAHILRSKKFTGVLWALKLMKHLRAVYQRESRADVMQINWLQNAIPLWGSHTPALITVLGTDYKLLALPGMVPLLRAVIKQRKTIIAPNAHWMRSALEKQFGDIAQIRPIPFGVRRRWFDLLRQFPGQGTNKWLTVSRLTANKIGPLFEWGTGVFNEKNVLWLLGPNQENLPIPEWVVYKGATCPEELEEKMVSLGSRFDHPEQARRGKASSDSGSHGCRHSGDCFGLGCTSGCGDTRKNRLDRDRFGRFKTGNRFYKHTGKQQAHGGRGKKLDKRAYRNLGGLRPTL